MRVHKITFYHPKIERISDCFQGEAYLVGGFVRDRLIRRGVDSVDIDLVVKDELEKVSRCISSRLKKNGFSFEKEKTVSSFVGIGWRIDVSTMDGSSIEEDLKNRDFTVNALAVNLSELFLPFNDDVEIVDPTGGVEDLVRGVIRPVSGDAIAKDPLRILRGIRLANILDFSYSKEFVEQSRLHGGGLFNIPSERIRDELLKMLPLSFGSCLRDMKSLCVLDKVFREIEDFSRIPPSGLHQFDLLEHTLRTVEFLETFCFRELPFLPKGKEFFKGFTHKEALKLAALYHDVGKPKTIEEKKGRLTFYNHDKVGAEIAFNSILQLGFGKKAARFVSLIIRYHLRPFFLYKHYRDGSLTDRAIFKFFRDCKEVSFHVLVHSVADWMATSEEMERRVGDYVDFLLELVSFYRERMEGVKPLLTGDEILEIKPGIPGRCVGRIKEKLFELQVLGKVQTKEEAEKFVRGFCCENSS